MMILVFIQFLVKHDFYLKLRVKDKDTTRSTLKKINKDEITRIMGQRGEENLEIIQALRFPLKSCNSEVQSEIFLDLENPDLGL